MDVEAIVARIWPGAHVEIQVLGGGITNHNFKVDAPGGPYVLRVAGQDTELLGIDRVVEYEAALAAAAVGVGPEVVELVEPEGYLVTRYVEGEIVPLERMREPDVIARVAHALRAVHRGPSLPARFNSSGSSRTTAASRSRTAPRCRRATCGRVRSPGGSNGRAAPSPSGRVTTTFSTRTSSTTAADQDRRLGVRGHGRRLLRPCQLLRQQRARRRRAAAAPGGVRGRAFGPRTSARSS